MSTKRVYIRGKGAWKGLYPLKIIYREQLLAKLHTLGKLCKEMCAFDESHVYRFSCGLLFYEEMGQTDGGIEKLKETRNAGLSNLASNIAWSGFNGFNWVGELVDLHLLLGSNTQLCPLWPVMEVMGALSNYIWKVTDVPFLLCSIAVFQKIADASGSLCQLCKRQSVP